MRSKTSIKNWTYWELKAKLGHLKTEELFVESFCRDKGGQGVVVPGVQE